MNYLVTVDGHAAHFHFATEAEAIAMAAKLTGWGIVRIWRNITTIPKG